jgi:glycosyltransferase involved in cell wall biosynthesis
MALSIVIPAYNEKLGIHETIQRCKKIMKKGDELLVVGDGSTDDTKSIAKKAGARVIFYPINKGKAAALQKGFQTARNDIIVTIDADCTYPPEAIPRLITELENYDMVVGSRFTGKTQIHLPLHRYLANKGGAAIASIILGKDVTDVTSGLRAFRKEWILKTPIHAKGLDFEAELTARAIAKGFRYTETPISVDHRKGQSSLRFTRDIARFFVAIVRGKFSK